MGSVPRPDNRFDVWQPSQPDVEPARAGRMTSLSCSMHSLDSVPGQSDHLDDVSTPPCLRGLRLSGASSKDTPKSMAFSTIHVGTRGHCLPHHPFAMLRALWPFRTRARQGSDNIARGGGGRCQVLVLSTLSSRPHQSRTGCSAWICNMMGVGMR